ncbi:MAG TPA: cache domain-containing protein, partial [Bacteroidia bacterium]|nr:cache domain-containing protein [Bacteroidia bacterium]
MKNIFKLSNKRRSHAEIWVVLFLILVLVGYYYMLYIPSQQNRLVEQKFRSLSRIDENIHNKIESYQKYIRSYVFDSDLWNSQKIREKIEGGNYYDEDKKILIKRRTDNSKIIPQDSAKTILDIQNNQLEQIVYTCSENGALEFSQRNNFKEFIRPLLTNDLFDNYLILSDSGVLFESFPSGMSFKKLDSVFDSRSTIHYCKLRDIEIGGVSYKMFLQPLGNLSGSEIVIVGLLTTGNFNANVRQLPEALITPILYILLSILLLFPLLKLMLMGKAERMRFVDLLFSYISLMMLCGTTILILCRYSPQVDNETNKHLETISNQIESNFNTEVHSAFRHLSNLDSIVNDTKNGLTTQKKSFAEQQWGLVSINDKDKINFDKKKNTDKNNSTEKTDKTENQNQFLQNVFNSIKDNYIRISQVYWIDPNAKIRINWTEAATNPPFGMVDDRKYFSAIKEQQFYYLDNDITQPYYLQPVISWSDKQYKLVISKPSIHKDFAATGMSCYFNSLIRTTLPPGISFALLDEGGEVLAHSDSLKNLRENMYNESDAASVISGIQLTEVPRHFNTKYSGGNYSAYAKKIKGLPYVLVVFEDRSYESSRYVSALFYALILFGSLLVVMLGEILLLSFNGYNRSVLKKNDFNFNWIFPRTGQRQKYWMITATNGLLIIILPLYFTHVLNGNVELILKSLITTFLLSTLFYTLVSCEKNKLKFEFNRKKGLLFWSFMLILFFMLFHSAIQPCTSRALLRTLGPAGITLGICILNFSLLKNGITYRGNSLLPDAGSARRSYSAVVFSRILLTCGMPVMYFYCSGYNLILRNEAKEKLFVFAQQVNRYNKSNLDPVLYPANCSMPIHQFLGIYFDQFWISDTCRYESKPGT